MVTDEMVEAGHAALGRARGLYVSEDEVRAALTAALAARPKVTPADEALLAVVSATRAYLPPDGIDAQECLNRILAATDNAVIANYLSKLEANL